MDWVLLKFGQGAIAGWEVYDNDDWHDMIWLDKDVRPKMTFEGKQPTVEEIADIASVMGYDVGRIRTEGYQAYFRIEPIYNEALVQEINRMYQIVKMSDIEYSAVLSKSIGTQVNPSIKLTTVKPSGTVALLPFVSSGVHAHYFKYGIRRIQVQANDPLLKLVQLAGYKTEPYNKNPDQTWVIEFPVKAPTADFEDFRSVSDITIEEQFAMQALLCMYWADNMVSCTITFHEDEKKKIKHLLEQYRMRIKSTSLLPYSGHGYVQAPYEPFVEKEGITVEEQYAEAIKNIQFKPHELYHVLMNNGEFTDKEMSLTDALECAGGVCPVR
jgi:hypothetical protein